MDKVVVESFTMDHRKVKAPFISKCGQTETPKGDVITKFDLRFTQPNEDIMPSGAVHALEHLLAGFLREELTDIVDLSPMGCRTGFYLIKIGDADEADVVQGLIDSLRKVLLVEEVPAANPVQCGNYRDMSLIRAKEYAKQVIDGLQENS